MTKKILITGANGQLGHEMRNALKGNNRFECIFTDVAELDICNAEAVKQTIADNHTVIPILVYAILMPNFAKKSIPMPSKTLLARLPITEPA